MGDFIEAYGEESIDTSNTPAFSYTPTKSKILQHFDSFIGAPFTIQRLCEILMDPMKHYKRTDKFLRGIEKTILVVSIVEPKFARRTMDVMDPQLVNGLQETMEMEEIREDLMNGSVTSNGVNGEDTSSSSSSSCSSSASSSPTPDEDPHESGPNPKRPRLDSPPKEHIPCPVPAEESGIVPEENIRGEEEIDKENIRGEEEISKENIQGDDIGTENVCGEEENSTENIQGEDDLVAENSRMEEEINTESIRREEEKIVTENLRREEVMKNIREEEIIQKEKIFPENDNCADVTTNTESSSDVTANEDVSDVTSNENASDVITSEQISSPTKVTNNENLTKSSPIKDDEGSNGDKMEETQYDEVASSEENKGDEVFIADSLEDRVDISKNELPTPVCPDEAASLECEADSSTSNAELPSSCSITKELRTSDIGNDQR